MRICFEHLFLELRPDGALLGLSLEGAAVAVEHLHRRGLVLSAALRRPAVREILPNIFSFSFQGVQLLTLTASVLLDAGAARRRLALPMRAQVVLFAAMSALVFLPLPPDAFFAATVGVTACCSFSLSTFQSTLYSLAALMPAEVDAFVSIMSGMAFGAVLTEALYLAILSAGAGPKMIGTAFFIVGTLVLAVAAGLLEILLRIPLVRANAGDFLDGEALGTVGGKADGEGDVEATQSSPPEVERTPSNLRRTARALRPLIGACFLVFFCTLAIFPGLADAVRGSQRWYRRGVACATCESCGGEAQATGDECVLACAACDTDSYWLPVYCFVVFNVFDWIGRLVVSACRPRASLLLPLAVLRLAFLPAFLALDMPGSALEGRLPGDVWAITVCAAFALSNGYVASATLDAAPKAVIAADREAAGKLMATVLSWGLALGAFSSSGLKALVLNG